MRPKKGKTFKCSHCSKEYKRIDFLQRHKQVCPPAERPETQYFCYFCAKDFPTARAFNVHYGKCLRSFKSSQASSLVHSSSSVVQLYICSYCQKGFSRLSTYNSHKTIHEAENTPKATRMKASLDLSEQPSCCTLDSVGIPRTSLSGLSKTRSSKSSNQAVAPKAAKVSPKRRTSKRRSALKVAVEPEVVVEREYSEMPETPSQSFLSMPLLEPYDFYEDTSTMDQHLLQQLRQEMYITDEEDDEPVQEVSSTTSEVPPSSEDVIVLRKLKSADETPGSTQVEVASKRPKSSDVEVADEKLENMEVEASDEEPKEVTTSSKKQEASQVDSTSEKLETAQLEAASEMLEKTRLECTDEEPESSKVEVAQEKLNNLDVEVASRNSENAEADAANKKPRRVEPASEMESPQMEAAGQLESTEVESSSTEMESTQLESGSKEMVSTQVESTSEQTESTRSEAVCTKLESPVVESASKRLESPAVESVSERLESPAVESASERLERPAVESTSEKLESTQVASKNLDSPQDIVSETPHPQEVPEVAQAVEEQNELARRDSHSSQLSEEAPEVQMVMGTTINVRVLTHVPTSFANKKPFSCAECGRKFRTESTRKLHAITHRQASTGKSKKVKSRCCCHQAGDPRCCAFRQRISPEVEKTRRFECSVCKFTSSCAKTVLDHKLFHHQKKFKCSDCNRSFRTRISLHWHTKIHTV